MDFGKRKKKPGKLGPPTRDTFHIGPPWHTGDEQEKIVGDAALVYIRKALLRALASISDGRHIHIETMHTVLGSLAGFSAQHAIWELFVKTGRLKLEEGPPENHRGAFVVHRPNGGGTPVYYFGDLLNSYIIPQSGGVADLGPRHEHTMHSLLAGAVISCGRPHLDTIDLAEIMRRKVDMLSQPEYDMPRVPRENYPKLMPKEVLDLSWSSIKKQFAHFAATKGRAVNPGYWPFIFSLIAQELIIETKSVIAPELAMRLFFEAAIPMSKVDPQTVICPFERPANRGHLSLNR